MAVQPGLGLPSLLSRRSSRWGRALALSRPAPRPSRVPSPAASARAHARTCSRSARWCECPRRFLTSSRPKPCASRNVACRVAQVMKAGMWELGASEGLLEGPADRSTGAVLARQDRGWAGRSPPRSGTRRPRVAAGVAAPAGSGAHPAAAAPWARRTPRRRAERPAVRPLAVGALDHRHRPGRVPGPLVGDPRTMRGETRERREVPAHQALLGQHLRLRVLGGRVRPDPVEGTGGVAEQPAQRHRAVREIPLARTVSSSGTRVAVVRSQGS